MSEIEFDRDHFIMVEWPEALVSGEFEQGISALNQDGKFCCLGVACELLHRKGLLERRESNGHGVKYGSESGYSNDILPPAAVDLLGISGHGTYWASIGILSLTEINDRGRTFPEIAVLIKTIHAANNWHRR